jgi:malto-oligosyltrehalose synthase
MDEVSLLQHADAGETPLASFWHRISGRAATFAEEEALARRQILERSFSAQRASLVEVLYQLAQADITTRDFSRATIDRCVTEILVHFPVYRIYSKLDEASAADQHFLGRAMQGAEGTCLPGDRLVLKALGPWLIGRLAPGHAKDLQSVALARFQQLSAPLCAKAVEDTALYRYGRLLSRNDVGFDAGRFACTIDQFHERMRRRRYEFPLAMLATATHDHKRGEDVRARLAVLSECSAEWDRVVAGWLEHARAYSAQIPMAETLSDGDLLILFQTVIGAWSPTLPIDDRDGLASYAKRIAAWQQKALREAKLHTDWIVPNEAYEDAASRFVAQLFEGPSDLLKQIADFAQRLMAAGIANSLSQLIIKLSAPGVPDIYRGTEFWDFSLVDPDNRAPVDFASRNEATESILHEALVANWRDGRLKQHILKKALAARRRVPSLFADGDYMPLVSEGPLAEHVAAYARVLPKASAIIVFSRFTFRFLRDTQLTIRSSDWRDTRLIVPDFLHNSYFDQLTGAGIRIDGKTYVSDLLSRLPVGLFLRFL